METEKFYTIFKSDIGKWKQGDSAFAGLMIMSKYIDPGQKLLIAGAGYDEIYGPSVIELCEAGITEDDAKGLHNLGWIVDDEGEGIKHFV